jgi:hypothetical protein
VDVEFTAASDRGDTAELRAVSGVESDDPYGGAMGH